MHHRLMRTGLPPLEFDGGLVAESRGNDDGQQVRWYELFIYRTDGGRYVAEIAYLTEWEGEEDHTVAVAVETAGELARVFTGFDPTVPVRGFPPLPEYADRQRNLHDWITRRYNAQVGELLALVDGASERIE